MLHALSWNRSTSAEQWEHLYFRKGVTFPMLGKQPTAKLKPQLLQWWMVQGAVTVQAASLHTVSGGTAEGRGHLCAHTLGSSMLEISQVPGSWWDSGPALLVLSTAVPEDKAFSLHAEISLHIEITLLCFHLNPSLGTRSMTKQKNVINTVLQIGAE